MYGRNSIKQVRKNKTYLKGNLFWYIEQKLSFDLSVIERFNWLNLMDLTYPNNWIGKDGRV